MATSAIFAFLGFPTHDDCHFYVVTDGYPTGAAWRFSSALRIGCLLAELPACFVNTQLGSITQAASDEAANADYRYKVVFQSLSRPLVYVTAWRRLPWGDQWIPRCESMPLNAFVKRFLPEPD